MEEHLPQLAFLFIMTILLAASVFAGRAGERHMIKKRKVLVDVSLMPTDLKSYPKQIKWVKDNYPGVRCSTSIAEEILDDYFKDSLKVTATKAY